MTEATFTVDTRASRIPVLSGDSGFRYRPAALSTQGEFLREGARKNWKTQSSRLVRRTTAYQRDPVSVACVLDAVVRMEHTHAISSSALADFLNTNYPQMFWRSNMVGAILNDLAEAAKAPSLPPQDLPIAVAKSDGYTVFQFNTSPRAWRWLLSMRGAIGSLAEKAMADEVVHGKSATLWADFPWELAENA